MHIISKLLLAVIDWLNAPGVASATPNASVDWADLPTYHPPHD